MGKPIYLFLFVFVLLAVNVYSETYIIDNFEGTSLDTSIWNLHQTGDINFNVSDGVLNVVGNLSNGLIDTSDLTTIAYLNSTNSGEVIIDGQYISGFNGSSGASFIFALSNRSTGQTWYSSPPTYCGIVVQWSAHQGVSIIHNYPSGSLLKTINASVDTLEHNIRIKATRYINYTLFEVYFDGVLQYSDSQALNCASKNLYVTLSGVSSVNKEKIFLFDNFDFEINGTLAEGLYPIGVYVGSDKEKCIYSYAEYGKCALKPVGIICSSSVECLSNSCIAGKCQDTDLWTKIDNGKNQFWGDTTATNNFISLVIILGGAIGLGGILGIWGALAWIVLGVVFFTMVGWLSAFYMVGMFMIGLIILVLGAVIGSKG